MREFWNRFFGKANDLSLNDYDLEEYTCELCNVVFSEYNKYLLHFAKEECILVFTGLPNNLEIRLKDE